VHLFLIGERCLMSIPSTVKYSADSFAGSVAISPRAGVSLPSSQPHGALAELVPHDQVPNCEPFS